MFTEYDGKKIRCPVVDIPSQYSIPVKITALWHKIYAWKLTTNFAPNFSCVRQIFLAIMG